MPWLNAQSGLGAEIKGIASDIALKELRNRRQCSSHLQFKHTRLISKTLALQAQEQVATGSTQARCECLETAPGCPGYLDANSTAF